jgi:hypothetical protein
MEREGSSKMRSTARLRLVPDPLRHRQGKIAARKSSRTLRAVPRPSELTRWRRSAAPTFIMTLRASALLTADYSCRFPQFRDESEPRFASAALLPVLFGCSGERRERRLIAVCTQAAVPTFTKSPEIFDAGGTVVEFNFSE